MAGSHTDRGLDRLVNFTDAAVAIAITLLVLPLVDLVTDGEARSVAATLVDGRGTFLAFAVSFVVIAHFWVGHHRLFEHLRDYSNAILWTNFLWLASIVLIPFTTQLLGDLSTDTRAGNALYIGVLVVTSASLALIEWLAVRSPELQRPEVRGRLDAWGAVVSIGLLLVALVLNLLAPRIGMLWVALLFLTAPLARLLRRR
ncbi:TMEM175 family protein [Georgenia faecalis]|uniref:TMEM175 family protein n=1 Tax=Georgenia faecalis TaxID=2483799 RepID=A0ABV9D619_9MICO|nr:TMEM175 family protein [Georgenia faecalis]